MLQVNNTLDTALFAIRKTAINLDAVVNTFKASGISVHEVVTNGIDKDGSPKSWFLPLYLVVSAKDCTYNALQKELLQVDAASIMAVGGSLGAMVHCSVTLVAQFWPFVAAQAIFSYLNESVDPISPSQDTAVAFLLNEHFPGVSWSDVKLFYAAGVTPETQDGFTSWLMSLQKKYEQQIEVDISTVLI